MPFSRISKPSPRSPSEPMPAAADQEQLLGAERLPSADRSHFLKDVSKRLGFNAALLSGALGLSAFESLVRPSEARGEIISTLGTQEEAKARGAGQTVAAGGHAVYVRADYTFPGFGPVTQYFSGFLLDSQTFGSAAHGFDALSIYNPSFAIGISPDYRAPTLEIPIQSFVFHPSYAGGVGGGPSGLSYDLAAGRLAAPIIGVSPISFWNGGLPPLGTDVFKVGYGLSGTSNGYDFSDRGNVRGVFSTVGVEAGLFGDPSIYKSSYFDPNRADGGRAASGDSGGPGYIWNPVSSRYELAFVQIAAPTSPSGGLTESLYLGPEPSNWLASQMTAVPEPSSLVLGGLAALTAAGYRYFRRTNAKLESL